MINYKELFKKSKEIEKTHNLTHYEVLLRFMFERILERISVSKYQNNFILKGGLLLTAIFGINNRTTRDMDATITGIDIDKEKMINVINEILSINLNDGVKFNLIDITDIREEDEYGGNKYHIVGKLENLKVNLEIDISTGDTVTPKELKFEYPLIFEDRKILISSYNMETILSEKIETILRRGQYNARMKDFYDVYIFITKLKDEIDIKILKEAMKNTFVKRNSVDSLKDYEKILNSILQYDRIKKYWNIYKQKNKYAENIELCDIINELNKFINNTTIKDIMSFT